MSFSPGMMYTVHNFVRLHLAAVALATSPAAGGTLGRKQAPEAEGIWRNQKFLFSQIQLQVQIKRTIKKKPSCVYSGTISTKILLFSFCKSPDLHIFRHITQSHAYEMLSFLDGTIQLYYVPLNVLEQVILYHLPSESIEIGIRYLAVSVSFGGTEILTAVSWWESQSFYFCTNWLVYFKANRWKSIQTSSCNVYSAQFLSHLCRTTAFYYMWVECWSQQ